MLYQFTMQKLDLPKINKSAEEFERARLEKVEWIEQHLDVVLSFLCSKGVPLANIKDTGKMAQNNLEVYQEFMARSFWRSWLLSEFLLKFLESWYNKEFYKMRTNGNQKT